MSLNAVRRIRVSNPPIKAVAVDCLGNCSCVALFPCIHTVVAAINSPGANLPLPEGCRAGKPGMNPPCRALNIYEVLLP